ncbi:hypothetical protein AM493_05345 [Flavobacterium akiainvivens]|uniref:Uncharacterized protein n=1 Tax=Flavobacterium akiainvivens TaxID=1202724 RepID=A0A0M9VHG1_9FLAO|nr:hypothetical protein [Flavobacterium akiainvivens]KOS05520.1 hypothetical protein AM493_05345 [Flavobacterium akiainvivens]SFQ33527.1 hypothetical protein SAMN05444144_103104 [Flavobacterium akiainvivens]
MKHIVLLLIFTVQFLPLTANAQSRLKPCESIFGLPDYRYEYYSAVREKLFNGLPDKEIARMLTMPSFFPENVLNISQDDEKYSATYVIAEENIWYSKERSQVKVKQYTCEIDPQIGALLELLYEKITSRVEVPESRLLGSDGENHYFFSRTGSGTIWSPSEGSLMGEAVSISQALASKVMQSKGAAIGPDPVLQLRIKTLIEKLSPGYENVKAGYFIPDAFPLDADAEVFRVNTTNPNVKVYESIMLAIVQFPLKNATATCLLFTPDFKTVEPELLANEIKQYFTTDMLVENYKRCIGGDNYFITNKGFSRGTNKGLALALYSKPDKESVTGDTQRLEWIFEGELSGAKPQPGGKPIAQNSYGQRVVMFFRDSWLSGIILYNNTK